MGYNIIDLIDKAIDIESRRKNVYNSLKKNKEMLQLQVLAKILCDYANKRIKYFQQLKEEAINIESEEIDIILYDKISSLINEFNKKFYIPEIDNPRQYLIFYLDLARDKYSLFIDVRGRFLSSNKNINKKTYEILDKIINSINEEINTIEKTIH